MVTDKHIGRHFPDSHFQMHFLNENESISTKISLQFARKDTINSIVALAQKMVWRRPVSLGLNECYLQQVE